MKTIRKATRSTSHQDADRWTTKGKREAQRALNDARMRAGVHRGAAEPNSKPRAQRNAFNGKAARVPTQHIVESKK